MCSFILLLDIVDLMPDICVTFWQKEENVDGKKKKLKSGDSLKIEKKYKDLESASASRKRRSRKRSSSYTSDPCTPPKDAQMSSPSAVTTSADGANKDATELDRMLITDEHNYLNTPQQATCTPDSVGRKHCLC